VLQINIVSTETERSSAPAGWSVT